MLKKSTKKTLSYQILSLVCLLAWVLPCYGAVIFEDSFDQQPDWNVNGTITTCGTAPCAGVPSGWDYYYQMNSFGQPTARIFNQADHTSGSGKAYIIYSESDPNINWPSDSQLSKLFPQDYQELYWSAWIKMQAGWQSASNGMFKVLRVTHYDRTGDFYTYFSSGYSSPTFLMELGSSPLHGTDYIPAYRCEPQSNSYYCPQAPYNNDTFTQLGTTVQQPTASGMYADGQWHHYTFHVKMNTQTGNTWNSDGISEFWYDGVLKMSHKDVQWKYAGSGSNDGWNSISIGGNANNTFSSQGEQWYAIDDVVVSTTPIPEDYVIGGGSSADTTAPTVNISSPSSNATVSGTYSVTANASDNVGVTKVEFYVNGTLMVTDTTSPYLFSWDSTTVANGTYSLTAKAYDAAGNVGQSSTVTVTANNNLAPDTTAPSVSISSPANSAAVSGTVTVSANATDNVSVSKVEFCDNGSMVAAVNTAPFSFNWNSTSAANGTHTLTAKAYDAAGNVGQSSAVTVTVNNQGPDTAPPTVSFTSPANNSVMIGSATFSVNASDNVGVTKVVFYINGVLDKTFTSAPYSYVVPSTVADNGVYTLTAKAYDAAGNVGQSAPITITVNNPVSDTTAPTASITSPSAKASVSGTVNVAANATDNVGIAKVEFYVNGALAAADTSAPYSFTWDTTAVANGSCTLLVKAYDAAGNVGQSSATTVTVNNPIADTILPTAAITSPAAGAAVSGTVTITASASDNVGVSKVEFYVNGALKSTASSAPFTSVWDTTQTANGTGTLVVKAYDAAGNIGTSAPVTITVNNSASGTVSDTTAPTVSITAPTSTFVSGSNVTISATATDSAGVARTELYIDGKLVNQSNGGAIKWSWNTTSYARGSHVIMVKAYDASNNAGSSSKSVYKYR